MGGLARRATFIQAARTDYPNLLVLDAGNTLWSETGLAVASQGKVMVEAMNLMHYSAMALGETDLQLGEDILRQRIADAQFPVISANVVVLSTGKLLCQPYVLLDVGGRKVGLIGLTGSGSVAASSEAPQTTGGTQPAPAPSPLSAPSATTATPPPGMHVIGSLAVADANSALQTYLKELQAQTSIIIVLSNLGWEANLKLADKLSGVDLIVSAGPGQVVAEPSRSAKTGTLVVQGGVYPQAHPGQIVGNIEMHLDSAGAVTSSSGTQMALGPEYDDDEQVRKLLNDYQLKQ